MRLNSELILSSPAFFNTLRERELDLRGNRIPAIENLGVTENGFDTIDLSENELRKLENFPFLPRLQTLMVSRNKIREIAPLDKALPNLKSLVLIENELETPQALDVLATMPRLISLAVLDNPLMTVANARLYLIYKLPQLRIINFQRVKQAERAAAKALYGKSAPIPKPGRVMLSATSASNVVASSSSTSTASTSTNSKKTSGGDVARDAPPAKRPRTEADQAAIMAAIQNATSVEEIQRLEQSLRDGRLPNSDEQ